MATILLLTLRSFDYPISGKQKSQPNVIRGNVGGRGGERLAIA
jgi:hypothetical protein